jgi:hypothetical protein
MASQSAFRHVRYEAMSNCAHLGHFMRLPANSTFARRLLPQAVQWK